VGEKGNSYSLLVGREISAATAGISMETAQKLKIELPYHPAISRLGTYVKESKSAYSLHAHPYFLWHYSQ
jgi:hypothetical protein